MTAEEDFAGIEESHTNDTAESNGSSTVSKSQKRTLRRKRAKQRLTAASENANTSNTTQKPSTNQTGAVPEVEKKKKKKRKPRNKTKAGDNPVPPETSQPLKSSGNVRSSSPVEVEKVPETLVRQSVDDSSTPREKAIEKPLEQVESSAHEPCQELPAKMDEVKQNPAVSNLTIEADATQSASRSKLIEASEAILNNQAPVSPETAPAPKATSSSQPKPEMKDVYHDDNASEAAQKKETCECSGCIVS